MSSGKNVHVSELQAGSDTSHAVDGSSATCTNVAESDRPYLVIDMGLETSVHSVTLLPSGDAKQSGDLNVDKSLYDGGGEHWRPEEDDLPQTYLHPPCIEVTGLDVKNGQDYNVRVRDVNEKKVWFTITSGDNWDNGDLGDLDYNVYEPKLTNFRISVGNSMTYDPETYETCKTYIGSAVGGKQLTVECDEPVIGRYMMIHLPGDGHTGQNWEGIEPLVAQRSFSICNAEVHGLPAYSYGFPCKTNDDCTVPFTNQYLQCVNGSCVCAHGFINHYKLDICIDIDECFDDNGGCQMMCVNTPGSYYCECPKYYELAADKKQCVDKNECTLNNVGVPNCMDLCGKPLCLNCTSDRCTSEHCISPRRFQCQQTCDNTVFPYKCGCYDGYYLSHDNHTCLDINECESTNPYYCDMTNGWCENRIANYTCHCKQGWMLATDGKTCVDKNECLMTNGGCEHICTNHIGYHNCSCRPGYNLLTDHSSCEDINECVSGTHKCDVDKAECRNTVGSYECYCKDGWIKTADSSSCADVDECQSGLSLCDHTCYNTAGSYTCSCNKGYTLANNKKTCNDIDECVSGTHTCDVDKGECRNTEGSYECYCKEGWIESADKTSCTDVDECQSGLSLCDYTCYNTAGSYTCSCNKGYTLANNKKSCNDIDECASNKHNCASKDMCTNTAGGFLCRCPDGKVISGTELTCDEVSLTSPISQGATIGLGVLGALLGLTLLGLLTALCCWCCRPGGWCYTGGGNVGPVGDVGPVNHVTRTSILPAREATYIEPEVYPASEIYTTNAYKLVPMRQFYGYDNFYNYS